MKRFILTLLIISIATLQSAQAQETKNTTEVKSTDVKVSAETKAEIEKLINDLQTGKFLDRKKATEGLIKLGAAAVPAVSKAVTSEVVEVRGRSMEILKEIYNGKDAAAKKAAKDALTKISEGDNELIAIRAKQILRPVGPANPNVRANQFGAVIAGRGMKVSTRTVNGVKHIDAEENGTKYKMVYDPKNKITVEITTKDAKGKETTKKFQAKNLDELKKKHPEAHKAYERYSKPLNVARINIAIGPGGVVNRARVLPIGVHPEDLDKVNKQLEGLIKRLGEATAKNKFEDVKKITEELIKVQATVKKIRADADKGIEGRFRKTMEARGQKIPR
jgi:hypothetical protein